MGVPDMLSDWIVLLSGIRSDSITVWPDREDNKCITEGKIINVVSRESVTASSSTKC